MIKVKLSGILFGAVGSVLALFLVGCGDQAESRTPIIEMPTFSDDKLMAGRNIWLHTCRACHLVGVGGAPSVTDHSQWEGRLSKGKVVLAQRIIEGVRGEGGKYRMPPRGGNKRLTDEQVKLALDYKIAAIQAIKQHQH